MKTKLNETLRKARTNGVYFITITRVVDGTLRHYQIHTPGFPKADLLPSLEELAKLLIKEHPELNEVADGKS